MNSNVSKLNANKYSSQQYTYLTVKQCKQQISKYSIDYQNYIQDSLQPFKNKAIELFNLKNNPIKKQQIIYQIVKHIQKQDSQYKSFKQQVKSKLNQYIQNLTNNQSKKSLFMTDCLRQSMSYPWKEQNKQFLLYNFSIFFKQSLNKQTRRILWQKMLTSQHNSQTFYHYNHQITPYNVQNQFRVSLQKMADTDKIKLKQAQKDIAVKLLQYVVKRYKVLPSRSQIYLSLNLIDLFSYYQPSKIQQIGSIYCGLQNLTAYYFQPKLQVRINNIFKAFQLVDEQSYQMLTQFFFTDQNKQIQSRLQLNQIFQHFRLSLGSKLLPFSASQYLIDQLLIKKRNKFDIYVIFAIVMLVLGDHIQSLMQKVQSKKQIIHPTQKLNFSQSLNNSSIKLNSKKTKQIDTSSPPLQLSFKTIFQNSKQIIKKQDIVQAFQVIYQKIPSVYSQSDVYQMRLYKQQENKLFQYLFQSQKEQLQKQFITIKNNQNKFINKQSYTQNTIDTQEKQLAEELERLKNQITEKGHTIKEFVKIDKNNKYQLGNA